MKSDSCAPTARWGHPSTQPANEKEGAEERSGLGTWEISASSVPWRDGARVQKHVPFPHMSLQRWHSGAWLRQDQRWAVSLPSGVLVQRRRHARQWSEAMSIWYPELREWASMEGGSWAASLLPGSWACSCRDLGDLLQ